jgi:Protein of unknown function (DUF1552)
MNRIISRRNILHGAGIALTLPFFESLAPRLARAQDPGTIKRYMAIFLPNGASDNWRPASMGAGNAWQLSPVLEPLTSLKSKTSVITNLENGSVFNADGSSSVEPSHGRQPGAWLTCISPDRRREELNVGEANGISVDQLMAQHQMFANKTAIPSLQLGLSTVLSYCDGQPCSNSRSVSWSGETTPMYKQVDPLEVFNQIVGVIPQDGGDQGPDPETLNRIARRKSVLDAVIENATRTQAKMGASDRIRLDEFLTAVRDVEKRVTGVSVGMGGLACVASGRPTMATVQPDAPRQNTETYKKADHADAMNDLIVMALRCDATRIVSYMLEDERSEFTYDHVQKRKFDAVSSTLSEGTCPEYHGGGQHGSQDDFASITMWNVQKVAELCTKLDGITDPDGASVLDNTVVFFGGCMHGSNHDCNELPITLIGGGNLGLKQDQHVVYDNRPLRDLHYTVMNEVMGMEQASFGEDQTGGQLATMNEILTT